MNIHLSLFRFSFLRLVKKNSNAKVIFSVWCVCVLGHWWTLFFSPISFYYLKGPKHTRSPDYLNHPIHGFISCHRIDKMEFLRRHLLTRGPLGLVESVLVSPWDTLKNFQWCSTCKGMALLSNFVFEFEFSFGIFILLWEGLEHFYC